MSVRVGVEMREPCWPLLAMAVVSSALEAKAHLVHGDTEAAMKSLRACDMAARMSLLFDDDGFQPGVEEGGE